MPTHRSDGLSACSGSGSGSGFRRSRATADPLPVEPGEVPVVSGFGGCPRPQRAGRFPDGCIVVDVHRQRQVGEQPRQSQPSLPGFGQRRVHFRCPGRGRYRHPVTPSAATAGSNSATRSASRQAESSITDSAPIVRTCRARHPEAAARQGPAVEPSVDHLSIRTLHGHMLTAQSHSTLAVLVGACGGCTPGRWSLPRTRGPRPTSRDVPAENHARNS